MMSRCPRSPTSTGQVPDVLTIGRKLAKIRRRFEQERQMAVNDAQQGVR